MGEQESTRAAMLDRLAGEGRRFQRRFEFARPEDELRACSRPPGWDESGFPLASRELGLAARVLRLLER